MNGWTNVGTNSSTYETAVINQTGIYTYRVLLTQNSGCTDASAPFELEVVDDPTVSVSAAEEDICFGGTAVLTAEVIGGAGIPVFTWEYNDPDNGWVVVGPTTAVYEITGLALGDYEYRVSVDQNSGCFAESASVIISVVGDPTVTIEATSDSICVGGTGMFTAIVDGGAGGICCHYRRLRFRKIDPDAYSRPVGCARFRYV